MANYGETLCNNRLRWYPFVTARTMYWQIRLTVVKSEYIDSVGKEDVYSCALLLLKRYSYTICSLLLLKRHSYTVFARCYC